MKTILVGLTILGLTNLTYSQSPTKQVKIVNLEEVILSPMKNVSYFNAVNDEQSSNHVKNLQSAVGNYDITKTDLYANSFDNYEVLFSTTQGRIIASYDGDGELLNSFEKFEGVRLPEKVSKTLKSTYPEWSLNSTIYRVNYYNNKDVKKVYQVQLKKGDKKMNLKIDCDGMILNPKNNTSL